MVEYITNSRWGCNEWLYISTCFVVLSIPIVSSTLLYLCFKSFYWCCCRTLAHLVTLDLVLSSTLSKYSISKAKDQFENIDYQLLRSLNHLRIQIRHQANQTQFIFPSALESFPFALEFLIHILNSNSHANYPVLNESNISLWLCCIDMVKQSRCLEFFLKESIFIDRSKFNRIYLFQLWRENQCLNSIVK